MTRPRLARPTQSDRSKPDSTLNPRFGLFISQVDRDVTEILSLFGVADDLGFDHAWLVDHLVAPSPPVERACHEAWTLLAGIAVRTQRILLGVLVSSNTFRHPALLLKQAVTVDHLSGGRVILGIGTGWLDDEHRRFGIELPPPGVRVDRLQEALELISLLMSTGTTSYHGVHYGAEDALLAPGPVRGRIPILVAAHRPRMLGIAARHADIWDTFETEAGTASDGVEADMAQRVRAVDEACVAIGRYPLSLRRSTFGTASSLKSVDAYLEFIRDRQRLGITDFTVVMPRDLDLRVLERIAVEVLPQLRSQASAI